MMQISTMISCGKIEECAEVVRHLFSTSHTTPEARHALSARLGDMIMKIWVLVGIPVAILALTSIAKVEKDFEMPIPTIEEQFENSAYAGLNTSTDLDGRGHATMRILYRDSLDPIMATWGLHQADFEWLQKRVIYGLFLSDNRILNILECQCLNVSGMLCSGFKLPTMWHIRGLRRLGVNVQDAETLCNIIKKIAREVGSRQDVDTWLKAEHVEVES
jgi:hypothetical protein